MTDFISKTAAISLLAGLFAPFFIVSCAAATEPPTAETTSEAKAPVFSVAPSAEDLSDGELRPYDDTRDARADVDATLLAAKTTGKNAIIVMGANWCHDSRALAGHFETPRFQTLFADNFEYVYVDMGKRDRNLDIAAEFGIDNVEGTPTIVIVNSSGDVLNLDTAKTWRNAYSRSEDDIFNEFESFAPIKTGK